MEDQGGRLSEQPLDCHVISDTESAKANAAHSSIIVT